MKLSGPEVTPMQCSVLSMCLTWAKVDAVKTAVELGCDWVVTVFDRDAFSCYHYYGLDVQDINPIREAGLEEDIVSYHSKFPQIGSWS